ncbi:hypothetical protein [Flavobacterium sp. I3-2]|uniref:hypothetical protein n=1 Tax=Flavobacterium sp. I3-2 TaxID=2748319 RepID=UPI0015B20BDC|nr:hypothetical protein [Flavobacterium sp. I3-2]
MNFTRKMNFKLDGIDGDFSVHSSPFYFSGVKLYQNGVLLSKTSSGFKGITYTVKNNSGSFEILSIKGNGFVPVTVQTQNGKILLERELDGLEKVLSFLPFAIFGILMFLFGGVGGIIGGFFIGLSIALSLFISSSLIRQDINKGLLVIYLILLGIILYAIYFVVTIIFALMMGGMISAFI